MYFLIFNYLFMIYRLFCSHFKTGSQYRQLNYLTYDIMILNFMVVFPIKVIAKNCKINKISTKNERQVGSEKYVHIKNQRKIIYDTIPKLLAFLKRFLFYYFQYEIKKKIPIFLIEKNLFMFILSINQCYFRIDNFILYLLI